MRRLLAPVLALLLAVPAHAGTYAGQVREVSASFRLRGLDGHLITLGLVARSSGLGGTSTFQELQLTVTDCGNKCAPVKRYVTALKTGEYSESDDLSITVAAVYVGSLVLQVGWSSDAGFGVMPPKPSTDGGAAVVSGRGAHATLVAGPSAGNNAFRPVVQCQDSHATVKSTVGLVTADRPKGDWPDQAPPGLRMALRATRTFRCA